MALALEGTPVHKNISSGSSTTMPAFTTSNPAVVYLVALVNGTNVSSVSGGGLSWSLRAIQSGVAGGSNTEELWVAFAAAGLSGVTITVTLAGATTFTTLDLYAFSGYDTVTPFDQNSTVPATNSGQISTTNPNDVVIGNYRMSSGASPTAGVGWTQISGANFQLCEYMIVSSAQTNLQITITSGGLANGSAHDAVRQAGSPSIGPTFLGRPRIPGIPSI